MPSRCAGVVATACTQGKHTQHGRPPITPLQFLLGVMRDPTAPADLRTRVARAAAPLVHGKPEIASPEVGKAGAIDGFTIDIEEAKALRDIQ
jgi:hypothetical protein